MQEDGGRSDPECVGDRCETLTRSLELVSSAQTGDSDALDRLFARYYERVRRVVRLRLGSRLRGVLESGDILQETFAAAVKGFDRFEMREEASLINWLSKLAERQILAAADFHGAKKRDRAREVGPMGWNGGASSTELHFEHAADEPLPDEVVADEEQAALVEACIDELPDELRELVILRNYAGSSWEGIAELTGRPSPDAARMKHARAVMELGRLLRERGAPDPGR